MDINGQSAAERHSQSADPDRKPKVLWKDVLEGNWKGPDPVLIWTRGSVCVFPQGQHQPIWVPERYVRRVENSRTEEQNTDADSAHDPRVDPAASETRAETAMGSSKGMATATAPE